MPYFMYAQDTTRDSTQQSKIETKLLTKGILVRKEFIPLGIIQSKNTRLDVEILKLEDLTNTGKTYGVKINYETSSGYSTSTKSAFIDRDEIKDVIIALKKINEEILKTVPNGYTEVIYICRSGYQIGMYYDKSKKWQAYMRLEKYNSNSDVFLEAEALLTLQILLQQAQAKFD